MLVRQTTPEVIRQAARDAGVSLDNERPDGRGYRFVLRRDYGTTLYRRRAFHRRKDGKRAYATGGVICWHGHRAFMRRLFQLAPDAILISTMARYDGAGDFESRHGFTAYKEVGSMADSAQYSELCDCEEGNGL